MASRVDISSNLSSSNTIDWPFPGLLEYSLESGHDNGDNNTTSQRLDPDWLELLASDFVTGADSNEDMSCRLREQELPPTSMFPNKQTGIKEWDNHPSFDRGISGSAGSKKPTIESPPRVITIPATMASEFL